MASNVHAAAVVRNGSVDLTTALLNSGFFDFYDGTQPANAGVAVSTQTKGVRLTFNATAFGAASGGTATANAITSGVAIANITWTWARLWKSDGTTAVLDCSVGTSGADVTVPGATISAGTTVSCPTFTLSMAA